MLKFQDYIYQNIGRRIREFRDSKNFSRQTFVSYFLANLNDKEIGSTNPLSEQSLSNIENINIAKKRNPYLMSKKQFNLLPKFMGYSQSELVFGDSKERENTVKLILLAIILNGAKLNKNGKQEFINPFIDIRITKKDFEELVNELKISISKESAQKVAKELIKNNLEEFKRVSWFFEDFQKQSFKDINNIEEESKQWFEKYYPFFTNIKYFKGMQYLMNERDSELEEHSNLLIKLLIGNNSFAKLFMQGISNRVHNQKFVPHLISNTYEIDVVDFIINEGQFGALALDFKNAGYTIFIKAFDEMWTRNGAILMNYFNENLFKINLEDQSLKKINDEFLHEVITSTELSKILYELIETEKYDMETMKGHNTFDLYLQNSKIKDEIDIDELLENNLYKYVNNMIQVHNKY
ncbi:hypothetical protein CD798_07575 [Bacillaceae bacterium SAOS 7]|nr:hypothetical protein CD798_07575 [Bacillaceae bacterium SAOS 7]